MSAEAQQIVTALEQSHEAELGAAADSDRGDGGCAGRYGQTQQIIDSMNRQINCTTISVRPGFANTTCN